MEADEGKERILGLVGRGSRKRVVRVEDGRRWGRGPEGDGVGIVVI